MYLLVPDLARDRAAALAQERRRHRSIAEAAAARPPSRSRRPRIRRGTALVLARISLASAGAVRRLDACIADDMVRPLSRSHGA